MNDERLNYFSVAAHGQVGVPIGTFKSSEFIITHAPIPSAYFYVLPCMKCSGTPPQFTEHIYAELLKYT